MCSGGRVVKWDVHVGDSAEVEVTGFDGQLGRQWQRAEGIMVLDEMGEKEQRKLQRLYLRSWGNYCHGTWENELIESDG